MENEMKKFIVCIKVGDIDLTDWLRILYNNCKRPMVYKLYLYM